jgi:hypothetical protein
MTRVLYGLGALINAAGYWSGDPKATGLWVLVWKFCVWALPTGAAFAASDVVGWIVGISWLLICMGASSVWKARHGWE